MEKCRVDAGVPLVRASARRRLPLAATLVEAVFSDTSETSCKNLVTVCGDAKALTAGAGC